MKNPRVIIITATVGFFLSFIIALLSRAGIGQALLRAAVSAAVCALVVAGLLFAAQNFLLKDNGGAAGSARGGGRQASGEADDEQDAPSAGSRVNIVLNDEALPAEPDDPAFDVSGIERSITKLPERIVIQAQQRVQPDGEFDTAAPANQEKDAPKTKAQILAERIALLDGESPRKKAPDTANQSGNAAAARQTGFVTASPAEITAPRAANAAAGEPKGVPFASTGLVDLPDIGELVTEGLSSDDEVIADTDFSSATKEEVATGRKVRVEDVDTSDSKAMAGAIRTLLVNG